MAVRILKSSVKKNPIAKRYISRLNYKNKNVKLSLNEFGWLDIIFRSIQNEKVFMMETTIRCNTKKLLGKQLFNLINNMFVSNDDNLSFEVIGGSYNGIGIDGWTKQKSEPNIYFPIEPNVDYDYFRYKTKEKENKI